MSFNKPRNGTSDGNNVTLVEVVTQLKEFINRIRETAFAHFAHIFSEIIRNPIP